MSQETSSRSRALEDFFEAAVEAASSQMFVSTRQARLGPVELEICTSDSFEERGWCDPLALYPTGDGPAQARVLVWAGSSAGKAFPSPPWGNNYVYTHRGDIRGFSSPKISVAFNYECRLLSMWDRESRTAVYWTPDVACLKFYEWAAPLRTILHWIGSDLGLALTHAAAVGQNGRGLLLSGKGGSGKSTTSLACWDAGWQFVSDDYCWISVEPEARVYAIYKTAKLLPNQPTDLPRWSRVDGLSGDKDVFNLAQNEKGRLVESLHLVALLLPALSHAQQARLHPASPRDGLAGLSLSTMGQLAGASASTMKILRKVVDVLPSYHLDLWHPVSSIPPLLVEALGQP